MFVRVTVHVCPLLHATNRIYPPSFQFVFCAVHSSCLCYASYTAGYSVASSSFFSFIRSDWGWWRAIHSSPCTSQENTRTYSEWLTRNRPTDRPSDDMMTLRRQRPTETPGRGWWGERKGRWSCFLVNIHRKVNILDVLVLVVWVFCTKNRDCSICSFLDHFHFKKLSMI